MLTLPSTMKLRAFNKLINSCRNKKKTELDMDKVALLPLETRQQMGMCVIKHRGPVLVELIEGIDESWVACMGYLYTTTSKNNPRYTFRHKGEHLIR